MDLGLFILDILLMFGWCQIDHGGLSFLGCVSYTNTIVQWKFHQTANAGSKSSVNFQLQPKSRVDVRRVATPSIWKLCQLSHSVLLLRMTAKLIFVSE